MSDDVRDSAFEHDLRLVLQSRAPGAAPPFLVTAVERAEAARPRVPLGGLLPRRDGWLDVLVGLAVGLVGTGVVGVLIVALIVSAGARPDASGPGAGGVRTISWDTGFVTLKAESVVVDVGGRQFAAPSRPASLQSDPGSSNYRTLEVTWPDQGVEMRLNIYFGADEDEWWANEIRTYDGRTPGDWITYRGEYFRSAIGSSWTGDVDLGGGVGRVSGSLHIDDLRLSAFGPGTVHRFDSCTALGPTPRPGDGAVGGPIDQPLLDTGIKKGMSAAAAHALLNERGICHEFRVDYGNVFSQRWCVPPPGKIESAFYGSEGQAILWVEDPAPQRTFDPSLPQWVGC